MLQSCIDVINSSVQTEMLPQGEHLNTEPGRKMNNTTKHHVIIYATYYLTTSAIYRVAELGFIIVAQGRYSLERDFFRMHSFLGHTLYLNRSETLWKSIHPQRSRNELEDPTLVPSSLASAGTCCYSQQRVYSANTEYGSQGAIYIEREVKAFKGWPRFLWPGEWFLLLRFLARFQQPPDPAASFPIALPVPAKPGIAVRQTCIDKRTPVHGNCQRTTSNTQKWWRKAHFSTVLNDQE